jgi:catechol-2,3-dioxygenase
LPSAPVGAAKIANVRGEETAVAVFIGSVVLNVARSDRAGEFWSRALGYAQQSSNPEFLHPKERGGLALWVVGGLPA